jgi:hypothetical protein
MCAADGLATHGRLAALLATVLGLGLASRRVTTASENRDVLFRVNSVHLGRDLAVHKRAIAL